MDETSADVERELALVRADMERLARLRLLCPLTVQEEHHYDQLALRESELLAAAHRWAS